MIKKNPQCAISILTICCVAGMSAARDPRANLGSLNQENLILILMFGIPLLQYAVSKIVLD